jgi:hypothetical protein
MKGDTMNKKSARETIKSVALGENADSDGISYGSVDIKDLISDMKKNGNVNVLNYKSSPVGVENWEVCSRMLIHDLLEMDIPEVKKLLGFYNIKATPWGTYTMALPRWYVTHPKDKKK